MRKILYRQKVIDGNGNKGFHYWGFMDNGSFIGPMKSSNETYWTALSNSEQYTGLKDRNGVKIFEGDICKNGDWVEDAQAYVYRIEEIKYNDQEANFSGWNWNEEGMTCEVIGNIYLNPTTPA